MVPPRFLTLEITAHPMQATLPYDIWYYIALFLPRSLLLKLYSVHSAFLHHVLRIRYGTVTMSTMTSFRTLRCCVKNMSPVVAKHVRTLILSPDSQMHSIHKKPIKSIAGTARRVLGQINVPITPFTVAAAQGRLIEHITSMTNVDSLIVCRSRDPRKQRLQKVDLVMMIGIRASLSSHGSNLQSLSLSTPYINVLGDAPTISGLEAFKVTFYEEINPDDKYSTLISFITRHSQTLNSIAVAIRDEKLDPSYLFAHLPHLRRLTEVSITLPFDRMRSGQATNIDLYLQKHSHLLQKIKYHFCSARSRTYTFIRFSSILQKIFTNPILHVKFPQMMSLDIQLFDWDSRADTIKFSHMIVSALASYLKQVQRRTLISFTLGFYFLPPYYHDAEDFFSALENKPLRYLNIQTCYLTVDTLDHICTCLPQLYELVWTVGGLWGDPFIYGMDAEYVPPHSDAYYFILDKHAERFAKELSKRKRKFEGWTLRHLTIRHFQSWRGRVERIESLLEATLPSSISFSIVHVPTP